MSSKLAIYIPTHKRPHKLQSVVDNINTTTHVPHMTYLGVEPDDPSEINVTGALVLKNKGKTGYSDTIQTLYEATHEEYFFPANDDFEFLPGWYEEPIRMLEENPELMVIGMSDGNPSGNKSTVNMVRRSYIENQSGVVDMPNRVLYPYHHNYSDTEFYQTAVMRGVWAACDAPAIIHDHPGFAALRGKRAWTDETYDKNNATAHLDADIYMSRKHLF